jgi:hypothetical protein
VLRDRHGAVLAARAPDRDHEVRLALGLVARQEVVQQRLEVVVELLQVAVAPDVLDHPRVLAGQRLEVRDVVRVRQEPDVEGEVGVARRAVLVAEGLERHRELAVGLARQELLAIRRRSPVAPSPVVSTTAVACSLSGASSARSAAMPLLTPRAARADAGAASPCSG